MADYKVAVVAGVGSGIGARFVETFAQADYRVVALARNAESLEQNPCRPGRTGGTLRLLGN